MCNDQDVTQSHTESNLSNTSHECRQQYLNVINQHTNDKINSLIEDFNAQNLDKTRERRLYRQAMYTEKDDVLYELCELYKVPIHFDACYEHESN